jgi:hypothetical protein
MNACTSSNLLMAPLSILLTSGLALVVLMLLRKRGKLTNKDMVFALFLAVLGVPMALAAIGVIPVFVFHLVMIGGGLVLVASRSSKKVEAWYNRSNS